jgi:hypothetical protein
MSEESSNLTTVHKRAKSFNPFDNPIFQQTHNSARGCIEMVITVAIGIRNVCLRRHRKAEQVSYPVPRKKERSLHTCAQDVQITRTANNMVNRYNISLNYKLESFTK